MARISEKNERFRTKQEICKDLSYVMQDPNLHIGTKLAVIDQIFWVWSEFNGKHKGCRFWSQEALDSGLENKGLVHEHIVPRKIVRERLRSLDDKSPDSIYQLLEQFCIGVVVTKAEDYKLNSLGLSSKMPSNWDGSDPWARHKAAGIKVVDTH
ncbi:hypothetical protein ACFPK9_00560 [Rubritalea spongiae]|uniref:HNH endonuclease n=1 Tax=Rubritalea spongiae TaxID=430797 RepID=A0ABW5E2T6_9BACT